MTREPIQIELSKESLYDVAQACVLNGERSTGLSLERNTGFYLMKLLERQLRRVPSTERHARRYLNVTDEFSDIAKALDGASEVRATEYAHRLGDDILFIAGVFPEYLAYRSERGAMSQGTFLDIGARAYRIAAQRHGIEYPELYELSARFREAAHILFAGVSKECPGRIIRKFYRT